jgi:Protein of unknown function (DUF1161)
MPIPHRCLPHVAASWALLFAGMAAATQSAAQGVSCETLRAQIEDRIRGNGVANASVVVIDATETPRGRVVGQCQAGAKKLVYTAGAPAAAKAPGPAVITECFDGRTYTDGPCKR